MLLQHAAQLKLAIQKAGSKIELHKRLDEVERKIAQVEEIRSCIYGCKILANNLRTKNKFLADKGGRFLNHIENLQFFYQICRECDYPEEDIAQIILRMK